MEEVKIRSGEEFIRLGQAMKKAGLVGEGAEAKSLIQEGNVLVNGEKEVRRGRKLHEGDQISFRGQTLRVVKE